MYIKKEKRLETSGGKRACDTLRMVTRLISQGQRVGVPIAFNIYALISWIILRFGFYMKLCR